MKVLWIGHFIPYPPKGGMLQRSYHLVRELAREFTVDLVVLARGDTLRGMYPSVEQGITEAHDALSRICESVTFVSTPIGSKPGGDLGVALASLVGAPYTVRWLASPDMAAAVDSALRTRRYDLAHYDTISLAQYLPAGNATPSVLDHHNIESDMLHRRAGRERNWAKKAYFRQEGIRLRRYERTHCRRFAHHITCSDLDAERLLGIDASLDVSTSPNGVDVEYFAPDASVERTSSLIFVGGQGWYPNRDAMEFFADEVWPELSSRNPELRFELIGEGPSEKLLSVAASDPRFAVRGFVDDIRHAMGSARIYVCPIRDGGGTKLKILDALAMGKAIVAHPLAVEGIDVTDGEHVLLARTPREFIERIERIVADDELRLRLEAAARALAVERYSYERIGAGLRALYADVAERARPRGRSVT